MTPFGQRAAMPILSITACIDLCRVLVINPKELRIAPIPLAQLFGECLLPFLYGARRGSYVFQAFTAQLECRDKLVEGHLNIRRSLLVLNYELVDRSEC